MENKLVKKAKDLQEIISTAQSFLTQKNLDKLINEVIMKVPELLNAERCTLFIVDYDLKEIRSKIHSKSEISEIKFPLDKGIAGLTISSGKLQHVGDAYNHPDFYNKIDEMTGYQTKNMLSIPLFDHKDEVIAVLQVLNKNEGIFTDYDEELLQVYGYFISTSLENALLIDELNHHITTKSEKIDELTEILNTILESSTSYAIIATDQRGMIIEYNEGAKRIYGYTPGDIINKKSIHYLIDDKKKNVDKIINLCLSEKIFEKELTGLKKGGEVFSSYVTITPRKDRTGELLGFVFISRDISDQKEKKEREIETAKLKTLLETAGAVAHELNQPLTVLSGYLDLLSQKIIEESKEHEYLIKMQESIRKLSLLINQIKEIKKYKTKHYVGTLDIIDLEKSSES